jgi:hypothetical protein
MRCVVHFSRDHVSLRAGAGGIEYSKLWSSVKHFFGMLNGVEVHLHASLRPFTARAADGAIAFIDPID